MLEELKRCNEHEATRVDYVIIWASDRWARNTVEHFQAHDMVRATGARLVSITEPMIGEDTPESFYFEGMKAVQNQYDSMRTGRAVKGGLRRKAMIGGSYGGRRLGYIKTIVQLPDGRQISGVGLDPDRHDFIRAGFALYASGEYSLSQLANELYRLGLRGQAIKGRSGDKVGVAAWHRMLRNPYYAGQLVYKRGTPDEQVFEGRHPQLIDQATFDIVQTRLDEKRVAGERPQKRRHYLRGSVFCGDCGHRLIYGFSRGKNGQRYPYFFCVSRTRGSTCEMHSSISPKLIEQAIQRYYVERPVQLSSEQVERRTAAIEALVAVSQQAVSQVKAAKTRLIRALEDKQDALVEMRFSEKSISAAVFKRKQATLDDELDAAHASLVETETTLQLNAEHLRLALELAENVAAVYQGGDQQLKRGYNQAFFTKLYVMPERDEDAGQMVVRITGAELTEPYAVLLAEDLAENVLAEAEAIKARAAKRAPESQGGSPKPFAAGCSYFVKMAERGGFEPPNEVSPVTRFPVAPVQPLRHLSMDGSPICDRRRHDKATTPAPVSLVGSLHDPRRERSFRQDVRPRRHLRRHRHRRQSDHRLHRDPGPRRAPPEPGIPGIAPAARQLSGLAPALGG
jgi:site-specific DNA recombinase